MFAIFRKEFHGFLSSLIGYLSIGIFLVVLGLIMWVFPDYSILDGNYAGIDPLFEMGPIVFLFLVPAITMRLISEENQLGTFEILATKPITDVQIIGGKYLASLVLILFALVPTLVSYITVYLLGSPVGNLDTGAIIGSYIGLFLLGSSFAAIGLFCSSISQNQIVAFLLSIFLSFILYFGFYYFSRIPIFSGGWDDTIQKLGAAYHYEGLSRGLIDSRDLLYFFSIILIFLYLAFVSLDKRKW
jgi:ABC-2 type transport system permease protein